jgi:hypothetical protein
MRFYRSFRSNNEILGIRLSVLFMNPLFCPPQNPYYGAKCTGFVTSRVFTFGEKLWQLRSIHVPGKGWYLFPFILNTGGSPWNLPIISDPVLHHLNLNRCVDSEKGIPFIPQPLGKITRPLQFEWNEQRTLSIPSNDLRFNLFGGNLAYCIGCIYKEFIAFPEEQVIQGALIGFSEYGATKETVQREIDSLKKGGLGSKWTNDTIPIDLQNIIK